jgi:hypothetical protein
MNYWGKYLKFLLKVFQFLMYVVALLLLAYPATVVDELLCSWTG